MNNQTNDGGPAFPSEIEVPNYRGSGAIGETITVKQRGMSLRDWFAGQALMAVFDYNTEAGVEMNIARSAYRMADAMLKAREQREEVAK